MRPLLFFVICSLMTTLLHAQPKADSLERLVERTYGKEKLLAMHALIQEYFDGNDTRKALRLARQSANLSERIITPDNDLINNNDLILKPHSYFLLGKAHYKRKQFDDAEYFLKAAIEASADLQKTDFVSESERFLAKIDARDPSEERKFVSALKSLERTVSKKLIDGSNDLNLTTTLKLARNYEAKENYPKAIEKYEKAINLLKDQGESQQVIELTEYVASLHQKTGNFQNALTSYESVKNIQESSGDSIGLERSQQKLDQVIGELEDMVAEKAADQPRQAPRITSILPRTEAFQNSESLRDLATQFEEREDYEQSLSYYKLYLEANQKLKEEEYSRELALLEQSNELENREREIALLQQERELQELTLARNNEELDRQTRFRNSLIIGSLLLISLAVALYLLYTNKRKAHSSLTSAYDNLNQTQQKLSKAEKRIKNLLKQQVSSAVAQELLSQDEKSEISQKFVCVMFLDIRGFTPFAEKRSPEDIIRYQNDVFGFMIEIIERNQGIINQFLGDGFMATFGAPISSGNDCENAYQASTEIVNTLKKLNDENRIPHTRVGIGLHAGPVVAGNVGTEERKQYSITGNTVILASRIEQLNKQFNTQLIISEDVYRHLDQSSLSDPAYEEVIVKGRSQPIKILKVA